MNIQRFAVVALATLALAGCSPQTNGTAEPTNATEVSSPTLQAAPSPTTDSAAVGKKVPTSCKDLGSAQARGSDLQGLTAQPSGVTPPPGATNPSVPDGSTITLECGWSSLDNAGITVIVATVNNETAAQTMFEQWSGAGATCDSAAGYAFCRVDEQGTSASGTYPVTNWILYGGTTWVTIYATSTVPTALPQSIGAQIWG